MATQTHAHAESIVSWSKLVTIFTHSLAAVTVVHALTVLTIDWLVLSWMYKRKIILTA
jgi:predicted acyltransferase